MKTLIKNQRLFFISLIGIIIISSMLLFSYAYQKVSVDYEESSGTGMTINVGKLDVSFITTNRINMSNMSLSKDYKTSKYTEFTIDNIKSTSDIYYLIKLSNLEYDPALITEDFKYTLTEVVDNNESVVGSGDFKFLSGVEHKICFNKNRANYIVQGKTKKLRLYLWIKETNKNQNDLENTSFKGKIEINSYLNQDATKLNLSNLRIYGNSVQNGTPTIESPVEIVSLGESKNLFSDVSTENYIFPIATKTELQLTSTSNSISAISTSGSCSAMINPIKIKTVKGDDFTLSSDYTFSNRRYLIRALDENGNIITSGINNVRYNTYYKAFYIDSSSSNFSFSINSEEIKYIQVGLVFIGTIGERSTYSNIQLEKGTTSTNYTPYHYIDIVNSGKNLWNPGNIIFPKTYTNAYYVGIKSDYYKIQEGKVYTVSTNLNVINNYAFIFMEGFNNSNKQIIYSQKAIGVSKEKKLFYTSLNIIQTVSFIRVGVEYYSNGTTMGGSGTIYSFQLEEGTEATSYEPYQEPIKTTINLDGYDSLKKVGDIADYIDLGQGKIVRKIGVIESYNGEIISSEFISSTGSLTTGAKVYYVLEDEIIEDIDVSQFNNIKNKGIIDIDANISASKIEFSI